MNTDKFFNLELEKEVLGALIRNNDKVCEVIDILQPNDFYRNNNKVVCRAIYELYQNEEPIDIPTLVQKLGTALAQVGGITYLSELVASCISSVNVNMHAQILKEKSNARVLHRTLKETTLKLENEDVKTIDAINELNNKTLNIKDTANADNGSVEQGLEIVIKTLEERYKNGGAIQGIQTGFSLIDKTINGLNKAEFIVVAARPSMGKTAFANNIAVNAAIRKNAKVSMFSLEMGKEQLLERMLSNLNNIEFEKIKKGNLSDKEWGEIARATGMLGTKNLRIYDKVFSLNAIKTECKKRKLREGLDIVIIDYLQLIQGHKSENRQQEVSDISRSLKLMAKELDCNVIALSQLSRAPEQRADHRPMLSDLRESGAIEQDADIIMFLYRDEYYRKDTEDKGVIENIIAKNRNGELGTIKLLWFPQYQKVGERTPMTYEGTYETKMFDK